MISSPIYHKKIVTLQLNMSRVLLILSIMLLTVAPRMAACGSVTLEADTAKCDTCCDNVGCTYWIKQIIDNGFRIHDPNV